MSTPQLKSFEISKDGEYPKSTPIFRIFSIEILNEPWEITMGIDGKQFKNGTISDAKLVESYINSDGTRAMTGDLAMGSNKITGLSPGTNAGDAATKGQLDTAVEGISWVRPAVVKGLIGNATIATIDGLTPAAGDAYVCTSAGTPTAAGSDAMVIGSIAEFDGSKWVEIVSGSSDFVASGTRAILSTSKALISPYTSAQDEGKIVGFDGTSLTGVSTDESVDGNGILISAPPGVVSYFENMAHTYQGSVPTGEWIIFRGAGSGISTGNGLEDNDGIFSVLPENTSVSVSVSGLKAAVPTASNKGMQGSVTVDDGDQATSTTVAASPAAGSRMELAVNGVFVDLRSASKAGEAFISGDDGTNARAFADVISGDTIHWNGSIALYQLAATDRLDLIYVVV